MDVALRDDLVTQLIRHEGKKSKLYLDSVGKMTIGIGHNIEDKGLSDNAIRFICNEDIDEVEQGLNQSIPWWVNQPNDVKLVLLDMAFNLGVSGLLQFKRTLSLIKDKNYKEASTEMLKSRWAEQVGRRAIFLSNKLKNYEYV